VENRRHHSAGSGVCRTIAPRGRASGLGNAITRGLTRFAAVVRNEYMRVYERHSRLAKSLRATANLFWEVSCGMNNSRSDTCPGSA
jgi:hypothetical protein